MASATYSLIANFSSSERLYFNLVIFAKDGILSYLRVREIPGYDKNWRIQFANSTEQIF